MKGRWPIWQAALALLLCLAALARPAMTTADAASGADPAALPFHATKIALFVLLFLASVLSALPVGRAVRAAILFAGSFGAAWMLLHGIGGVEGTALAAFYLLLAAAWLLGWGSVSLLSALKPVSRCAKVLLRLLIPAIFGAWILIIWEAVTRGAGVPFILLPPPSAIAARIAASVPTLAADMRQTILKAVLAGYLLGCGAGFAAAVLADRFDFLRRGLLPVGNMVSALPIIGVAPIMVIWFGFDWQSKAAVVVIMTFSRCS